MERPARHDRWAEIRGNASGANRWIRGPRREREDESRERTTRPSQQDQDSRDVRGRVSTAGHDTDAQDTWNNVCCNRSDTDSGADRNALVEERSRFETVSHGR